MRLLAIDVGAGTQDVLLYDAREPVENSLQLVLPSPTVIVARRIRRATAEGRNVFLTGRVMGGGASTRALREHLRAGLRAAATEEAARTFHDDIDRVREMGVEILAERPGEEWAVIETGDVDVRALLGTLEAFEVEPPDLWAVAVQDHGFCPSGSNRLVRFERWRRFLASGGMLPDLLYREAPAELTRMRAVQEVLPGAFVMDTGAAAILGALCDPVAAAELERGLVVVNVGNGHTLAALVRGRRVTALFEHHTSALTGERLAHYVSRLRDGSLTHEEVFGSGGHGCTLPDHPHDGGEYRTVVVTGPNRGLARGLGYHEAAPYGDMMLSGCFGLVEAVKLNLPGG